MKAPPLLPRLLAVGCLMCCGGSTLAEEPVSFRNDVMAVLSRGGCNQGTCHGNLQRQGRLQAVAARRGPGPGLTPP